MSQTGVVLIKAPPCTGKTSQLQLLSRWLRARSREVVHISFPLLLAKEDVLDFIERHDKLRWGNITAGAETSGPSVQRWALSQWQCYHACWYCCCVPVNVFGGVFDSLFDGAYKWKRTYTGNAVH